METEEFSVSDIFDPFFLETLHKRWLDEHFTLGTEIIDAQHLWVVALLVRMELMLKTSGNRRNAARLTQYATEILKFLDAHLELEQLIIKTIEMPQAEEVLHDHAEFMKKLREAFVRDTAGNLEKPDGFVEVLKLWVSRHIKVEDARWKVQIGKKHFNPNDFVRAILKDPVNEAETAHALLYRQLMVQHEVIPGIKKETLDDLFLLWKRFDIRTNVPLIDMQHMWLFKMVVEIEGMLHRSFDERRKHLEAVLSELLAYVDVHFGSEEGLMAKIGYAGEKGHHKLHEDFRRTVLKLKAEYDGGNHHSLSSLITIMRQWLLTHIVMEDSKIAHACEKNPQQSLDASRALIREKGIPVPRDQTLVYMYISARLKAG